MSSITETQMTVAEAEALCEQFIERGVVGVFFVSFEHQTDRETTNLRITERPVSYTHLDVYKRQCLN